MIRAVAWGVALLLPLSAVRADAQGKAGFIQAAADKKTTPAERAFVKLQEQLLTNLAPLRKELAAAATDEDKEKAGIKIADVLARHLESLKEFARKNADDPLAKEARRQMGQAVQALGQSWRALYEAAYQKHDKARAARLSRSGEAALRRVAKDFAGEGDVAAQAREALYLLTHLSVGKVAPDTTGKDLDDKELKLSDYRGKVVVLAFWGHW
jgi:hypothetical protein